jgi:hypothetical protein
MPSAGFSDSSLAVTRFEQHSLENRKLNPIREMRDSVLLASLAIV